MDCSPPGSSVHGILQARILEWVAISFPRASSWPKDWTRIFRLAGGFFATEPPRKSTRKVLLFFKHWNYSAWRDVSILLGLGRLRAESIQSLIWSELHPEHRSHWRHCYSFTLLFSTLFMLVLAVGFCRLNVLIDLMWHVRIFYLSEAS